MTPDSRWLRREQQLHRLPSHGGWWGTDFWTFVLDGDTLI
jgi:hypothetical protein